MFKKALTCALLIAMVSSPSWAKVKRYGEVNLSNPVCNMGNNAVSKYWKTEMHLYCNESNHVVLNNVSSIVRLRLSVPGSFMLPFDLYSAKTVSGYQSTKDFTGDMLFEAGDMELRLIHQSGELRNSSEIYGSCFFPNAALPTPID